MPKTPHYVPETVCVLYVRTTLGCVCVGCFKHEAPSQAMEGAHSSEFGVTAAEYSQNLFDGNLS